MSNPSPLAVAFFDHVKDNEPNRNFLPWPDLTKLLTTHDRRADKDGALWSPTAYRDRATRGKDHVESLSCLVLDFDDGVSPGEVSPPWARWEYLLHSTFSHTPDKPKFRAVFPLAQPVAAAEWPAVYRRLALALGRGHTDPACKDCSRIYYLPSAPPGAEMFTDHHRGEWLDPAAFLEQEPESRPESTQPIPSHTTGPDLPPEGKARYARAALESERAELAAAQPGKRNAQLNRAAYALGQLVGAGLLNRAEVEAELEKTARTIGLEEKEIRPTIKSGLDAGERDPREVTEPHRQSEPTRKAAWDPPAEPPPTPLAGPDPSAGIGAVAEPSRLDAARQRIQDLKDGVDARGVWSLVDDLALLPTAEYGSLKQELKQRLGRAVSWGDFDAAVEECRKELRPAKETARSETQAEKMVRLAMEAANELFRTDRGDTYLLLQEGDHFPCYPIKSTDFRRWLRRRYTEEEAHIPSDEAVKTAVEQLDALAWGKGRMRETFLRVASQGRKVYIDLANDQWQALEIDAAGWRVVNDPPVAFVRGRGMLPLPIPTPPGNLGKLRDFVNVTDEAWPLLLAFLVGCWGPGPYPVLSLTGEQGTGKSACAQVLKKLVDPNKAPSRTQPREDRDVMVSATHNHLLAYDNLSDLPVWLSDLLCCITSGTGYSKRAMYTDFDEVLLTAQRPVVVNGIAETVQRSDLLDRSLLLTLEPIPEGKRQAEKEFWDDFTAARPGILAGLCDAVSAALRNLPHTHPDRLPRMADFAKWVIAAESALGWEAGTFLQAYTENRAEAHSLALEGNTTASRLIGYMEKTPLWEGTSSELRELLYPELGLKQEPPKDCPKNARALSALLKRIAPNLRAQGLDVDFSRRGEKRDRVITLTFTDAKRTQNGRRTQTDANESDVCVREEACHDAEEEDFDPFTDAKDAK